MQIHQAAENYKQFGSLLTPNTEKKDKKIWELFLQLWLRTL